MRILIIEDAERKLVQLRQHLREVFPNAKIEERMSYIGGLEAAIEEDFELIVLDMSLPNRDVSPQDPYSEMFVFAGRDILQEMKRKKVECPVIIVTQFPEFGKDKERMTIHELREELSLLFSDSYLGTVYYHPSRVDWQVEIDKLLKGSGFLPDGN